MLMTNRVVNTANRKIPLAIFALSTLIVLIYACLAVDKSLLPFSINSSVAILAGISAALALLFSFWTPKNQSLAYTVSYSLLLATVSLLISTTGVASSIFLGVLAVVVLFSAKFGKITFFIAAAMIVAQALLSHQDSQITVATIIFAYILFGLIPLVAGYLLWRPTSATSNDKSMAELASKLSITKGKSDVVINSIDDGVVAINNKGIIDLINPAAQQLIGWNQGDALGLDWRSVIKLVNAEGREVTEAENPVAQALANNKQVHNDNLSALTSSDKKRLISIVGSPIDSTGASNSGIIVVFRDITSEKAEEREQAEFISTASHEMRTPVASIEGYLGLALNPATATIDDKARDFITKAHESAQHLGRLFQDLLDVSKSEDGRLKNDPQVMDVTASTSEVFEGLAHLAAEKQLRYIFKPNPSLDTQNNERRLQPVFYADIDSSHFREIISNLIENAIKYTLTGDIIVDVKGDDKVVTVSVSDSGIGIPTEDIPHLFQKFYRVDNSDTREIGGTGLGLYLCRRLAETMGGHLRVESEYKKGSTFFLDIPRTSHEDAMKKLSEMPETEAIIMTDQPILIPEPQPATEQPSTPQFAQPQQPTTDYAAQQPVYQQPQPATVPEPDQYYQPQPVQNSAEVPMAQVVTTQNQQQPVSTDTPAQPTAQNQERTTSLNVPPRSY